MCALAAARLALLLPGGSSSMLSSYIALEVNDHEVHPCIGVPNASALKPSRRAYSHPIYPRAWRPPSP